FSSPGTAQQGTLSKISQQFKLQSHTTESITSYKELLYKPGSFRQMRNSPRCKLLNCLLPRNVRPSMRSQLRTGKDKGFEASAGTERAAWSRRLKAIRLWIMAVWHAALIGSVGIYEVFDRRWLMLCRSLVDVL
ncbi:MAG: hypothetical protein Q9N34_06310, partial [Aquificota bacterium]|nr:hypothetical protein [Aquificota bacterium]